MSRMHKPPHPGAILKADVLPELGLSVTEAARQLGMSRVQFSRIINGKAALTPELALRLEVWLAGPTAETWLGMQMDFDLWHASRKPRPRIHRAAA